ncbi:MAG: YeeE/YedE thiosulfate transporter family protein [Deltaproteobacteria bacterium]|nr:YeeE/YedE thiosulfate transporter family protein [Myxococcales bacterium]MDP3217229.1 YeeE/YedE thiosulfate transporter family protein [Deltaproteobacteria bacterium]
MFDSPLRLALGLGTGVVFGFLLQKGQVAKYRVIMAQLLLRDWTVAKIMLTAIAVGAVGVYALVGGGHAELHVKPAAFAALLIGGVLFGVGMAVLGLCPGTAVAACGAGRKDAAVGVLGMLVGAGVYVAAYEPVAALGRSLGTLGKVTLPALTYTSPWLWIVALVVAALAMRAVAGSRRPEGASA